MLDSGSWWETPQFAPFTEKARQLRANSDFIGLESVYEEGYERAEALGNQPAEISYLTNLGTARMFALHYAPALEAYLAANTLAEKSGDWTAIGGIAVNLAVLYQQTGDAKSALTALERGKAAVDRLRTPPVYMGQLLMRLRSLQIGLNEGPTPPRYEDAIEAARQTSEPEAEAAAWDLLGKEKIAAGELAEAESDLGRGLRVRSTLSKGNLGFSYGVLGGLRLAQANRATGKEQQELAREAVALTERALQGGPSDPALYTLLHQRGQIREMLGQTELALEDFSTAVNRAHRWSEGVPPAQSLMTGVHVGLQHQVYASFVEAAAEEALRTGSQVWASDAFLALEANRAANLQESRTLAPVWKKRLPMAYWQTLAKLNQYEVAEEVYGRADRTISSATSERLRLVLTEMESVAGLGFSRTSPENFRARTSLTDIQHGLGESDLLLSFYLGKEKSYLWTVTQTTLKLSRLPGAADLGAGVTRFRKAVLSGGTAEEQLGADLYQRLFGSLDSREAGKTSWLLALDGPLFERPFAALVSKYENGHPVYAAESHSTQEIPGAMFLRGAPDSTRPVSPGRSGGFLGVGDPVYNSADPRDTPEWRPWRRPQDKTQELNRLVNTSGELRRSSQSWQAGRNPSPPVQILEGTAARREAFLADLNPSGTNPAPSTIHLATHVLTLPAQPEEAFLAFALDSSGRPGLLSASEVGLLHVPGALVVMTGCATATGDIRAGVGLVGLKQSWLMAGASTVVATNWVVPDADGDLIPAFYRNLRNVSASEALRRSQMELIRSGTWQASPSYWAAFQVTGAGR
ncbi:MAG TPA: CHAT domain-containing tetratricopeptide repeat protein [Bryobacteraceae bacterium]